MCKRWPGCPDEIRRSRIGSFCTTPKKKNSSREREEKKMELKTITWTKKPLVKNRAGWLQESTTPPGHAAKQHKEIKGKQYSYIVSIVLRTAPWRWWMKWNSELALHFIGRLPLPCPRRLPLPNNLPLRGNGLLSGLVARVWGGQPGQRAVPPNWH